MSDFLHVTSELGASKVHQWKDERFESLSGGERTKLALAHIWSNNPDLLIWMSLLITWICRVCSG